MNTKTRIAALILSTLSATLMIGGSACVTATKNNAPIEHAPEGKTPHIPQLRNAEAKAVWIPEKIEQDRWEEGHFLYLIEKSATWSVK